MLGFGLGSHISSIFLGSLRISGLSGLGKSQHGFMIRYDWYL